MKGRVSLYYSARVLLDLPIDRIETSFGEFGKPKLNGISVSISHSETTDKTQFCVCSAYKGDGVEVGIDAALLDKPIGISNLSKTELLRRLKSNKSLGTVGEWRQIEEFENENDQLNCFYRLWSIKESILKATGKGASGLIPSKIDIR